MLLNNKTLDRIIAGEITVVFRVWKRPTVKSGGTLTTRKGVLAIRAVDQITRDEVTADDITNAGLSSRDELCDIDREGDFYRITLRFLGADPRLKMRENLEPGELDEVAEKLGKMGGWTFQYLRMIAERPNIHAGILAASIDLDIPTFKGRVRRLKALGLTESLRPGYRLSPRGRRILENKGSLEGGA